MNHPIVTLKSGLTVLNFSSPHSFTFDDGSVLEACSPEVANSLMLGATEIERHLDKWTDIQLSFNLTTNVKEELLICRDLADIVLVPFPVLEAWKETYCTVENFRVCRMVDRVKKIISSRVFCI